MLYTTEHKRVEVLFQECMDYEIKTRALWSLSHWWCPLGQKCISSSQDTFCDKIGVTYACSEAFDDPETHYLNAYHKTLEELDGSAK